MKTALSRDDLRTVAYSKRRDGEFDQKIKQSIMWRGVFYYIVDYISRKRMHAAQLVPPCP
jgi:hypothetical protein